MIKTWTREELDKLGKNGYEVVGEYIDNIDAQKECPGYDFIVDVECSIAGRCLEYYCDDPVNGFWEGDWWEGGDVTLHRFISFEEAMEGRE